MENNVGFLQQREADLKGQRQSAALAEIEADFDNIRAAWKRAVERKNHAAVNAMIEGLYWYCWLSGHFKECDTLFSHAREGLAPESNGAAPHPVWARVVARFPSDNLQDLETSLEIARQQHDQAEVAWCLRMLGLSARRDRDWDRCLEHYLESLAQYRALNDDFYVARVLGDLAGCYQFMGQLDKSAALARESQQLSDQIGDKIGATSRLASLGITAFMLGDYVEAKRCWQDVASHEIHQRLAFSRAWLGLITLLEGDTAQAGQMADQALAIAREFGDVDSENIAQIVLGMHAVIEEDYPVARRIFDDTPFVRGAQVFASWGRAAVACGQGDYNTATTQNRLGLDHASTFNSPAWKILYLPTSAATFADRGKTERAVELLALAFTHPKSATGWLEQWPLITRLQADLKAKLGDDGYNAAWERGKLLDLEKVVQELLESSS